MIERRGVVGASEKTGSIWHKREDPLDDMVEVFCVYKDGTKDISYKMDGEFMYEGCFGEVMYWMHFPELPRQI